MKDITVAYINRSNTTMRNEIRSCLWIGNCEEKDVLKQVNACQTYFDNKRYSAVFYKIFVEDSKTTKSLKTLRQDETIQNKFYELYGRFYQE